MPKPETFEHGHFCWVDLASHGMQQAKAFYGDVFGWQAHDQDTEGGPPYAKFALEGAEVAGLGECTPEMKAGGVPPCWSSYVNVDDVDATVRRAQELGGSVVVPPRRITDAGRLAFLADPSGACIALWQPGRHTGAEVVDEPGAPCWYEMATRDIAAARDFFGPLFGWEFEDNPATPGQYSIITCGGRRIGGLLLMNEEWGQVPPHWSVYFAVRDADDTVDLVRRHGGRIHRQPFDTPVGRIACCADPQGATFYVIALTGASS